MKGELTDRYVTNVIKQNSPKGMVVPDWYIPIKREILRIKRLVGPVGSITRDPYKTKYLKCDDPTKKVCTGCKQTLDRSLFSKAGRGKYTNPKCKECNSIYYKERKSDPAVKAREELYNSKRRLLVIINKLIKDTLPKR
jgi:hypothetical protein